jgi:hypothetical protein
MKKGKIKNVLKGKTNTFKMPNKSIFGESVGVAATRGGGDGLRAHARTGGKRVSLRRLLCPGRKRGCQKREEIEEVYSSNVIVALT